PTITPFCTPSGYTFTTSAGATVVPAPNLVALSQCDDCVVSIPLPFQSTLYDLTVPAGGSISAGSNGGLFYGTSNSTFSITCIPNSIATYVMAPYWVDLYTFAGTAGC